jgi:hypothetical protein
MTSFPDLPPDALTPWRILVFDKTDPQDPRWLIATVTLPSDVRPAQAAPGTITGIIPPGRVIPAEVVEWVRHRLGRREVRLTPVRGQAWTIEEETMLP